MEEEYIPKGLVCLFLYGDEELKAPEGWELVDIEDARDLFGMPNLILEKGTTYIVKK